MANSKRLFGVVRRKLLRRSHSRITIIRSSAPETTQEEIAAVKIQSFFRGHLVINYIFYLCRFQDLKKAKLVEPLIKRVAGKKGV